MRNLKHIQMNHNKLFFPFIFVIITFFAGFHPADREFRQHLQGFIYLITIIWKLNKKVK